MSKSMVYSSLFYASHYQYSDTLSLSPNPLPIPSQSNSGQIGQEIIKVISGKGEPANNVLVFDGVEGACKVCTIPKLKK